MRSSEPIEEEGKVFYLNIKFVNSILTLKKESDQTTSMNEKFT